MTLHLHVIKTNQATIAGRSNERTRRFMAFCVVLLIKIIFIIFVDKKVLLPMWILVIKN
jgi:hypothetical protein